MREIFTCWRYTRMVVLIGLCASLYIAVLLAFKWLTIVPGFTEIRPAAALPIVLSVFFGPAAAWGSAFGNVIGDLLGGTIGPGSFFGIPGNFLYGYVPYRILRNRKEKGLSGASGFALMVFIVFLAAALCATIISLGVHFLELVPFALLVHVIFLNNFLVSLILAPILIRLLEKRIQQMRLLYTQIMEEHEISRPVLSKAGAVLVLALTLFFYAAMMVPAVRDSLPVAVGGVFPLLGVVLLTLAALLFL